MLAPARDTESLMTLWNDFNFALTEPQKDYLNEQNEFKLLTLKINDLDKAIGLCNNTGKLLNSLINTMKEYE